MNSTPVSEEKLWMVEDAFELSFKQILINDGASNSCCSREGLELQTPSIEIKFLPGKVTEGYRHALPGGKRFAYAAWKGSTLTLTIRTNRKSNAAMHKVLIAKVRKNCQYYNLLKSWPGTEGAATQAIADIREAGCSHSLDSDNDFDVTVMTFNLMHNLKESAWPTNI